MKYQCLKEVAWIKKSKKPEFSKFSLKVGKWMKVVTLNLESPVQGYIQPPLAKFSPNNGAIVHRIRHAIRQRPPLFFRFLVSGVVFLWCVMWLTCTNNNYGWCFSYWRNFEVKVKWYTNYWCALSLSYFNAMLQVFF